MRKNRQTAQKQISILTLDDDPIITSTIQSYFQRSGYQVDVENDPGSAIERVRTNHYDIMLLDFLMTPICGDQVVEEIRKFNQELFIILLTGHKSMAPPIKTIRQLDIQGYYEKSDRFDQLELLVESCVKSIRQMRTIRGYQTGLSVLVDKLPGIYNLQSMDRAADGILAVAEELWPSEGSFLFLDMEQSGDSVTFLRKRGQLPEQDFTALAAAAEESGTETVVFKDGFFLVPMEDGEGRLAGCLGFLADKEPEREKKQLLKVFSRQALASIFNSRLHERVNEKNDQLVQAYMQTIRTLRSVVEMRDRETEGHSERVAALGAALAEQMGLEGTEVERIRVAGLFHDIGKVGVPDEVLLKPESLSQKEYAEIQKHPATGERILSVYSPFADILPIVRGHHERFDGRGYPDGLKGEEICLGARIIGVADAFDAMISNRKYRNGLGLDRTIQEIKKGSGAQFDGQVVDALLAHLESLGQEEFMKHYCAHTGEYENLYGRKNEEGMDA